MYKKVRILTNNVYMKDLVDLYDGHWLGEAIVDCYVDRLRAVEPQRFHILSGSVWNKWRIMEPEKIQQRIACAEAQARVYNAKADLARISRTAMSIGDINKARMQAEEDFARKKRKHLHLYENKMAECTSNSPSYMYALSISPQDFHA